MQVITTEIGNVKLIVPALFRDERGYFSEVFKEDWFCENIQQTQFIQDNESESSIGTFRGMHYQIPPFCQSKLVRVLEGKIIDFVTDLRMDSETFGKTLHFELSYENKHQLWVPRGFAHGFLVVSDTAHVQYKVDSKYSPEHERSFCALDPEVALELPNNVSLSQKDREAPLFADAYYFPTSGELYG